ncbi:helix-turn-helix protein [Roseimicrobium gellanilyticum]|uniref:Helix-turn-helix protein n=1 Tax=Roseimicrobium gellanilyticum TaxID=748857 RepID=A0A366HNZ9_9BACT|nr:helix-turn-helix transcriptional regulator [Roseimicrobium gellanilyticum]RBP45217.1 helix-turn-helix protein [Roseimicrobium gellanilyticum]
MSDGADLPIIEGRGSRNRPVAKHKSQVPDGGRRARKFRNFIDPNVRELRKRLGLTQEQLAARLQLAGLSHLDRVAVAKVESQIRSVYDFELILLADVLQIEHGDLLSVRRTAVKAALRKLVGTKIEAACASTAMLDSIHFPGPRELPDPSVTWALWEEPNDF